MTTPIQAADEARETDQLERLIRFTVSRLGMVKACDLYPAFWALAPGVDPATIHDAANNLLAAGLLRLSPAGCYYVA